jgi:hypothetical protein
MMRLKRVKQAFLHWSFVILATKCQARFEGAKPGMRLLKSFRNDRL